MNKKNSDLLLEVLPWLIECRCYIERVCEKEDKKESLERFMEEYKSFIDKLEQEEES